MIKFLSIGDDLNFDNYDLVYMGSGHYENQELIIKHLSKYKDAIKRSINSKKFFIITGYAIDLFGNYIINNNKKIRGLNIFNYYVKLEEINFADKVLFKSDLIDEEIIGYQRQYSLMFNNNDYLFNVIDGIGNYIGSKIEGIHYKNFFGTYLIGPFLIRNPILTIYIIKKLILNKDQKFCFKEFNVSLELQAYYNYLNYNYGITH